MRGVTVHQKHPHLQAKLCYSAAQMTLFLFLLFIQLSCNSASATLGATGETVTAQAHLKPDDGSSNVSVSDSINISFNKEMDASTINSDTFVVTGPDGAISGTVSYAASKATFTPIAPLMPEETYRVVMTTDVRDAAGQALSGTQEWVFKTGKDYLSRSKMDVIPPTFFGLHYHRATTTTWPVTFFGTWRLWDAHVGWPELEPQKGRWNFKLLDQYVALAEEHNVQLVLPLALSPTWASARPSETSTYGPGKAAEPANIEDWRNYVRTVAVRYKGRIHYYEFWNEPNLKAFYTGTVDKLIELNAEAYKILKEVDPTITVISPSCTGGGSGLTWIESYLQKGGKQCTDIVGYHFYVTPDAPEAMLDLIAKVKQIRSKHSVAAPLWNTEAGWYIENHNSVVTPPAGYGKILTDSEAASYVARSYILNWATSVDRFYWYAWDNYVMGLTEADGNTTKAAAVAYREVVSWLMNSRMMSCGTSNRGTYVVTITERNGHYARIVWNPKENETMVLPKEWKAKTVKDLAGNSIDAENIKDLAITPAPILIED